MSLMDGFLLDPFPIDVWIAIRNDGALGSGSEQDPWSGGVLATPVFTVTQIQVATSPTVPLTNLYLVTLTTAQDHGFKTGDLVIVRGVPSGVTTYDYDSNDTPGTTNGKYLNGTFSVTVIGTTQFTYITPNYGTPIAIPPNGRRSIAR